MADQSLKDKLAPLWFYPLLLLALAGTLWIAYAMVSAAWYIFVYLFNWLIAR